MKFYIIAGERSGDMHGGNLVKAMMRKSADLSFRGFGGDAMQEAGVELVMHYGQLAFMGFEAVINFLKIAKYMRYCQADVLVYQPTALILIDYGGFNRRMAAFGKKHGITVFYYIPPKVWAWREDRAWQLKKSVDHIFVILPFEKEFFKRYDMEVDYVGNPVLDAITSFVRNPAFLSQHGLSKEKKIVALLPGSRKMELQRMVPVMAEVVRRMPNIQFVVAAVRNLGEELYQPLKTIGSVKFTYDATYDLLAHADAAIVTSGTATLETGLFKVPQVVIYKAGQLEYWIGKKVVKVPFISLVNLIVGKEVVKELIQQQATATKVQNELQLLLYESAYRNNMLTEYDKLYRILDTGSASENTANLIFCYMSK